MRPAALDCPELVSMFIERHRSRFRGQGALTFREAFDLPLVESRLLRRILRRYAEANTAYVNATRAAPDSEAGAAQIQTTREDLHLDLASFYLFGNMLADHLAASMQFCFGRGQQSIEGLSDLRLNLQRYAQQMNMTAPPQELLDATAVVHDQFSEYRDKILVHPGDPAISYEIYVDESDEARLLDIARNPNHMRTKVRAMPPRELAQLLDAYARSLLVYLAKNIEVAVTYLERPLREGSVGRERPSASS